MLNPSIPLVATRHGKIVGVVQEEIHIWRGIPYAAPPTGELRWRAPQPVTPWQDVRQADCSPAPVGRILPGVANSVAAIREIFRRLSLPERLGSRRTS